MSTKRWIAEGNEAAARVAYACSEVIAIYPITPSSGMGELSDEWAAGGRRNIWGAIPSVVEMQSEAGAAGAIHGAVQAGALSTTFTASQGLLLMLPNMYKIAGELTPCVIHVAARAVATHALSIFGDHQDVMGVRAAGWAMLCSANVQEAHDFAAIAHAATVECRIPFLHFFDGFRTSHEINDLIPIEEEALRALIPMDGVRAHRARGLSPEHPVVRGTAQNPDVYFQGREAANLYYAATPDVVRTAMERFAELTGRRYWPVEYEGHAEAERVVVVMGSGAGAAGEAVRALNEAGEKVGLLKIRLYRPFPSQDLISALPSTVTAIAVLDRTKEPGASGEPLYLDVCAALREARTAGHGPARDPLVVGGRYGLSSKEFTPAMVKGVLDELRRPHPRNHFAVGVEDDLTGNSITVDPVFDTENPDTFRALFYGLGADGTVGANKNTIKIVGEGTDLHVQGYFVYDSKKSGSVTVSHLRFSKEPIRSTYLIREAQLVACHQFHLLERMDVLEHAAPGGMFLLNSPFAPEETWDRLPLEVQHTIREKNLRLFVMDAVSIASSCGLGKRINTVMQAGFFCLTELMPLGAAIASMKEAIQKTYGKRGPAVVEKNLAAVDQAARGLREVAVPESGTSALHRRGAVAGDAPGFVRRVIAPIIGGKGDALPVSALPADGTFPSGTARWEKRNIAAAIPVWDADLCIQCGRCVLVCPHAAIRAKVFEPAASVNAPAGWTQVDAKFKEFPNQVFTLQVAPEDCTGCTLCVEACPAESKTEPKHLAIEMAPQAPLLEQERAKWEHFLALPNPDRDKVGHGNIKNVQLLEPLFEFSGACAGCGETPYLKLLTQLFGDRLMVANATGCSSIFGGNLPTTPWTTNDEGRGPAWANSLFEDNAEFGFGMALALEQREETARHLVRELAGGVVPEALATALLETNQVSDRDIREQRQRVAQLLAVLPENGDPRIGLLRATSGALVRTSVWVVGGDGWAYDIGYGGLDHVLAAGRKINVLVLDTEVYSNTGGQASKATPRGAVARFATAGKRMGKKDLGLLAIAYGHIYVARVAFGAKDNQTLKALTEADAYPGPSLVLAYSHCIAHQYDLAQALDQQKAAVATGYWPLYRYNPLRAAEGKAPMELDSPPPTKPLQVFMHNEGRFSGLERSHPEQAAELLGVAQQDIARRWDILKTLSAAGRKPDPAP